MTMSGRSCSNNLKTQGKMTPMRINTFMCLINGNAFLFVLYQRGMLFVFWVSIPASLMT